MRRRDFSAILLIAGAAMQPVLAQAPVKQRRIAIVASAEKPENISEAGSGFWRTFFGELRRLGHVEGVIWLLSATRPKAIPAATVI